MAVGLYSWSKTAASNGAADANINFAEGQAPPTLNNSARAQMAALKAWVDSLGGGETYGGSANAYTITQNAVGAWSGYAEGQIIGLEANHTCNGAATVNVDGLGAKSIVKGASTAVASGDIVSGAFYLLRYDGTNFQIIGGLALSSFGSTYQPLDATLTAMAAVAWSSGVAVLTLTAADTFALKLIGTSGDTIPKNNTENVYSATQFFEMSGTSYTARHSNTTTTHDMGARWQSAGTLFTYTPIPSGSEDTAEDFGYDFTNGYWFFDEAPRVGTAPVLVSGTQQIPIPAGAMIPATTNGAEIGTTETTTNKVMLRTLDFDTTTQEFAHFSVAMPKGWNEGTVTFQPIWTADSGSGTVVFALQGIAFSDDDALDTAFGTEQTSSDTLLTAGDAHIGPVSSAITIGGTPAEGDIVFFRVKRVPASDTLGVDARLIGIRLIIATNAPNDA